MCVILFVRAVNIFISFTKGTYLKACGDPFAQRYVSSAKDEESEKQSKQKRSHRDYHKAVELTNFLILMHIQISDK